MEALEGLEREVEARAEVRNDLPSLQADEARSTTATEELLEPLEANEGHDLPCARLPSSRSLGAQKALQV